MNGSCGIHSWGCAIPRRRLQNAATMAAWNRLTAPGARAIAGYDEDAITFAVQASFNALPLEELSSIDGLIFATTTSPFAEKSAAALIAGILNLPAHAQVLDVQASLRAGTNALSVAGDWIASGKCSRVLVVASDVRVTKPGAMDEVMFGHAGVAIVVGKTENAIAEIVAYACHNTSLPDAWRNAGERFPMNADQRFAREGAYATPMMDVMKRIQSSTKWQASDVNKVVLYSPDVKSGSALLKQHGFDLKTQYVDLVSPHLGLTGAAHTLLMCAAAFERSAVNERVLLFGYGDGADAFAFEMKSSGDSKKYNAQRKQSYDISYNHSLTLHRLHEGERRPTEGFTSEIMSERNRELWLHLKAMKCSSCGNITTLPLPSCPQCKNENSFEPHRLARTGVVFAVTHEHYYPTPEPPLGMASVNLDGGGRLTVQIADENELLNIGDRVELVLRRIHDAGNYPNYFWKCRAVEMKGASNG